MNKYQRTILTWILAARTSKADDALMLALAGGLSKLTALHFATDRIKAEQFLDACFADIRAHTLRHLSQINELLPELEQSMQQQRVSRIDEESDGHVMTAEQFLRDHFNPETPNG